MREVTADFSLFESRTKKMWVRIFDVSDASRSDNGHFYCVCVCICIYEKEKKYVQDFSAEIGTVRLRGRRQRSGGFLLNGDKALGFVSRRRLY